MNIPAASLVSHIRYSNTHDGPELAYNLDLALRGSGSREGKYKKAEAAVMKTMNQLVNHDPGTMNKVRKAWGEYQNWYRREVQNNPMIRLPRHPVQRRRRNRRDTNSDVLALPESVLRLHVAPKMNNGTLARLVAAGPSRKTKPFVRAMDERMREVHDLVRIAVASMTACMFSEAHEVEATMYSKARRAALARDLHMAGRFIVERGDPRAEYPRLWVTGPSRKASIDCEGNDAQVFPSHGNAKPLVRLSGGWDSEPILISAYVSSKTHPTVVKAVEAGIQAGIAGYPALLPTALRQQALQDPDPPCFIVEYGVNR